MDSTQRKALIEEKCSQIMGLLLEDGVTFDIAFSALNRAMAEMKSTGEAFLLQTETRTLPQHGWD